MPDFERSRRDWHNHLLRWGQDAALSSKAIRGAVERPMVMAMSQYNPRERASLALENAVRLVVSAYQVAEADWIDWELDVLLFDGKLYKIAMEPVNPRPDGKPIAWDCPCILLNSDYEGAS